MPERDVTFDDLISEGQIEIGAGRPRTVNTNGLTLPILRVADVLDGKIEYTSPIHPNDTPIPLTLSKVSRPGDIVLTTKGTVGRVALMPADGPAFAYSPQLCYFRPTGGGLLRSRFLYYWFKSADFWSQANALKGQTDMADFLSLGDLQQMRIRLPSTDRQDAIGDILGALDDKIAVNDRIAETALELGEACYIEASASEDWSFIELGSAARWHSGGTPKTDEPRFWNGEIPWISALSLKSCWIETSDRRLTELGASSGTRLVPAGAVVFVVRGSSLKEEFRIGLTQREVAFGQDCKALIPIPGIDPHILFHGIRSARNQILDLVDETSIGAGRLSTDLITKTAVRVPPKSAEKLVDKIRSLDEVSALRTRESRALSLLRDMVLPALMSGRLRVTDAEKVVDEAI